MNSIFKLITNQQIPETANALVPVIGYEPWSLRALESIALEEIEGCIADQKTVEDEIEARELARIIEAFLDTLTVKERVIFMRRYAYADTYADIAKRVGISEKNVSVRLALIRQKMKQYLIEREVLV